MPLKAVYDIDIDDTKFRRFKALFDKYQDALTKLPREWERVNASAGAAGGSFENLAKQSERQELADRNREEGERQINSIARTTSIIWTGLIESVRSVDAYLGHSTSSLLKWEKITASFIGLIGGGSLFGIDRLAASVSTQRKSALGLGISYGQQGAFNTNYSRLIDSQSLLSNASSAAYDVTSPQYVSLLSAGVSPGTLRGGNAADISSELLARLPGLFGGTKDRGLIGARAHAYGIDQLMSMHDLVAFLNATPEERKAIADRYAQDARTMNLTEEAQRKWQDFTTQIGRAAGRIGTTLADKLVGLEPGLEKLSDSFVKLVRAFADSGLLKNWIEGLAGGLGKFAEYVGTKEFQDKVASWTEWVGKAARVVWNFINGIGEKYLGPALNVATGQVSTTSSDAYSRSVGRHVASQAERESYIRRRAVAHGIDPDVAVRIARSEGLNNLADRQGGLGDHGTSGGDFQLHIGGGLGDIFRRSTGHDPLDPTNWQEADDFALQQASQGGWTPWHGATRIGVAPWEGINQAPTVVVRPNTGNNPVLSNILVANPYTAVGQ